ncbi:hypothetical protein [Polynucleobacter sp. AM-25C3]|uniref:hypothetical protein n=1 Tax=Polynucleobacter sp. AM-25C3 TaxID=1855569 RepID=UPI0021076C5F|nr:hypothetical protein [Polynucleobacter sp. AM-25C3]MBU3601438.1 hypothetical protein [Polynucleobacter sp. AM-25C3]
MNMTQSIRFSFFLCALFLLTACTVDKLEARLQADPQCKSVMNPKTGALMPCPGTDKEFYRAALASNPNVPQASNVVSPQTTVNTSASSTALSSPKTISAPVECKPQLHQKSGSLMPCPAP